MAALPFDDEAYRAEIPVADLVGEAGWTTLERKGARPTLDVNGIWGGFQGEGAKTIIPAHAHAKLSCRLVADQDPAKVFAALRDYVAEIAPPGVTVHDDVHPRRRSRRSPRSTIRRRGPPPGPSRRSTASRPSTSARAARSR